MRILSSTFWFAIFVFRALKCEAVILIDIVRLAQMAHPLVISGVPRIIRAANLPACAARCAHDVTARAMTRGMTWAMFSLRTNKIGPTFGACGA